MMSKEFIGILQIMTKIGMIDTMKKERTLGVVMRSLRNSKELTQEDLAKRFGMSLSSYSLYESEKREPPIALLIKLADFYNVSLDYLTGRTTAEKDFRSEKERLEKDADAAKILKEAIFLRENTPEEFRMVMNYFNFVYETARINNL